MDRDPADERIRLLEARLARIEARLGIDGGPAAASTDTSPSAGDEIAPAPRAVRGEEEIEFELGQNWFAKTGIVVLALGMAFILTFPYAGLPAAAPALIGYLLAGSLFAAALFLRRAFDLVSRYLRGAGMALLFFTTLRLFYFSPEPALEASSAAGIGLLAAVAAINILIGWRRSSPHLFTLGLLTGLGAALAVGETWFVLTALPALALCAAAAAILWGWTGALVAGTAGIYLSHLVWALNNPFLGREPGFVAEPEGSVLVLLLVAVLLALGTLGRRERGREAIGVIAASFLNGGLAYGIFLIHTAVSFAPRMVFSHLTASAVLLGLAIAFWVRERSRFSTFAYAMLGYMALSVALINASDMPELFVWLSLQSLVVVATAVWFRSRFIVVANFVIYLAVVAAYVAVGGEETGISIGFGVVALASARILNWRQDRLELKTEMMRNAYLLSALAVFPYATWHLVPSGYVALSWVGIAGFYYLMNLVVRAQKYRWMGHLTLLLTVVYAVGAGIGGLEPTQRIISFLVLGTVLLAGSLIFTRLRARRKERGAGGEDGTAGGN